MKKLLQSKGFKITALSACCIGILAACFFFGRDRFEKFVPDPQLSESSVNEWKEPDIAPESDEGNETAYGPAKDAVKEETYPKTVEESPEETVVDFTPPALTSETQAPDKPVSQGDNTDPQEIPTYQPEDTMITDTDGDSEDSETEGVPAAGDVNEDGAVYFPGFGWVIPSTSEVIEMDNDGDPNKMVGDM